MERRKDEEKRGIVGSARKLIIYQTLERRCGHLSTCIEEAVRRTEVSIEGLKSQDMMKFYNTH